MSEIPFDTTDFLENLQKNYQFSQPTYPNYAENHVKQMEETLAAAKATRDKKEAEELRRHEELVEAIQQLKETMKDTVMEALKMGASVNIDSNTGNINISMNSQNVQQQAIKTEETLDYQMAESTLSEISEFLDLPSFKKEFGQKTEEIKMLIAKLQDEVKAKKEPGVIKKGFIKLTELVASKEGSMITKAIWEGIKKIPGLGI